MIKSSSFLRNLSEFNLQFEKSKLSYKATSIIIFITSCIFLFFQCLMEFYIINSDSYFFLFFIGSYLIYSLYFVLNYHLKKCSISYNLLNSEEEQFYVLSNLIKSGLLCIYTPLAFMLLKNIIVYDIWDNNRILTLGSLYALPDFVSLFVVKKMQKNTIIHHVCVCIFYLIHINNDYTEKNVCRLLVVYSIFSTFSYLVNFLLASRYLKFSNNYNFDTIIKKILIYCSLRVYVLCCGINWIWHLLYVYKMINENYNVFKTYFSYNHITVYIYLTVISLVVYDDIILIKYLYYKYSKTKTLD